jgi:hypothetical protein
VPWWCEEAVELVPCIVADCVALRLKSCLWLLVAPPAALLTVGNSFHQGKLLDFLAGWLAAIC